ncbi:hypothetical protein TSUD_109130 [Trifolium subterraneum]|nr:hypothetical protein TSUD_109130 [Trifolium subterraneum]
MLIRKRLIEIGKVREEAEREASFQNMWEVEEGRWIWKLGVKNLGQAEGDAVNPNFVEGEIAVKIE